MLKLDPKNTVLLEQKQRALTKEITNTEKELNLLRKAQQEADDAIRSGAQISQKNYDALQRRIIETEQRLSRLKAEASNWNKAGEALVTYGNKLKSIGDKLNTLGNNLTTKLTLPIVALSGTLIKTTSEFESAFAGVKKTVDATPQQLEKIRKGIKKMAEQLPSTTTEIARVAEAAGQLGIKTEDILDFSKTMIDLGNSTNLSANEAASALAKFANVTRMEAKNYRRLGSTIVSLGNNFATTENDIVQMATRLAATGELTGLTQPQILSLATAMSSLGIEAEARRLCNV